MTAQFKYLLQLIKLTISEWLADNASRQAAALAFYGILSLAPLLVISVSVAGIFFGQADVQQQVVSQAEQLLGAGGADLVNNILNETYNNNGGTLATVISLVIFLFAATNIFFHLKSSLNIILDVEQPDGFVRGIVSFLKDRLIAAAMVIGFGFLLLLTQLVSFGVSIVISAASEFPFNTTFLLQILTILVTLGLTTTLISFTFRFLPDKRLPWRDVWVGGFFTAILFAIGQRVISMYLESGSVASAYGITSSLLVVLLWIYYVANMLLFGAEFTQAYAKLYDATYRQEPEEGSIDE